MTARQQWIVVGVVVALLAIGATAGSYLLRDELTQITIGSRAPQFKAVSIDSAPPRVVTLDDYRDNVVLLNIWATWCLPCRREMPSMEELHRALGDKGLKVVAVSVDNPGMEEAIREFVREYNLTFDILYDSSNTIRSTYRTTGVPESFVIARDGVIRKKWIGEENWSSEANRRLIESLLSAPTR